tara:strand:- start:611 stop:1030 length:420 start_codon:yes stop_codon:yes gene_type:complete
MKMPYSRGDVKDYWPATRYFAVFKDGADKPSDLVKEQPSGKLISLIDTMNARAKSKSAGWQHSVFTWSEDTDVDWVELSAHEVQEALASGLKDYSRAKKTRRSHAQTKRLVIEARQAGDSWAMITKLYGVDPSVAKTWL